MNFKVVVNHEEQFSILPAAIKNPPGWLDHGFIGTREECLEAIEKNWTDMRPKSIRENSKK